MLVVLRLRVLEVQLSLQELAQQDVCAVIVVDFLYALGDLVILENCYV